MVDNVAPIDTIAVGGQSIEACLVVDGIICLNPGGLEVSFGHLLDSLLDLLDKSWITEDCPHPTGPFDFHYKLVRMCTVVAKNLPFSRDYIGSEDSVKRSKTLSDIALGIALSGIDVDDESQRV